jgi:hypothetical protein
MLPANNDFGWPTSAPPICRDCLPRQSTWGCPFPQLQSDPRPVSSSPVASTFRATPPSAQNVRFLGPAPGPGRSQFAPKPTDEAITPPIVRPAGGVGEIGANPSSRHFPGRHPVQRRSRAALGRGLLALDRREQGGISSTPSASQLMYSLNVSVVVLGAKPRLR